MEVPRKVSLVDQVAKVLRQEIVKGTWKEWLPPERELGGLVNVNRRTVRAAIQSLCREGVLQSIPRRGTRIAKRMGKVGRKRTEARSISLLVDDMHKARPFDFDGILSGLQARCFKSGIALRIFEGKQFFRRNPDGPLEHLVSQHPSGCWLLRSSNVSVQNWFANKRVPTVIWGRSQTETPLPSVFVDLAAATRHAVGEFLRLGHRRLGLFMEHSRNSHLTRDVFLEAVRASRHTGIETSLIEHESEPAKLRRMVGRCLQACAPPTAILVTRAYAYVSIATYLAEMGRRIPDDVSAISLDRDSLFPYLAPQPASFSIPAEAFAKKLFAQAEKAALGETPGATATAVLPEFEAGQSLAARPIEGDT